MLFRKLLVSITLIFALVFGLGHTPAHTPPWIGIVWPTPIYPEFVGPYETKAECTKAAEEVLDVAFKHFPKAKGVKSFHVCFNESLEAIQKRYGNNRVPVFTGDANTKTIWIVLVNPMHGELAVSVGDIVTAEKLQGVFGQPYEPFGPIQQ